MIRDRSILSKLEVFVKQKEEGLRLRFYLDCIVSDDFFSVISLFLLKCWIRFHIYNKEYFDVNKQALEIVRDEINKIKKEQKLEMTKLRQIIALEIFSKKVLWDESTK